MVVWELVCQRRKRNREHKKGRSYWPMGKESAHTLLAQVADFGTSKQQQERDLTTCVGTIAWVVCAWSTRFEHKTCYFDLLVWWDVVASNCPKSSKFCTLHASSMTSTHTNHMSTISTPTHPSGVALRLNTHIHKHTLSTSLDTCLPRFWRVLPKKTTTRWKKLPMEPNGTCSATQSWSLTSSGVSLGRILSRMSAFFVVEICLQCSIFFGFLDYCTTHTHLYITVANSRIKAKITNKYS